MIAVDFPQSNMTFGPPQGFAESQVHCMRAFSGTIERGSCEGTPAVVVAWSPTRREIEDIVAGKPVFLSVLGGLPPHFLTTRFEEAINPA